VLEKLKDKLMAQSPAIYSDFLKCLSLYVQEVSYDTYYVSFET
jgi:histone deacetylase complex regulatory component SIN3